MTFQLPVTESAGGKYFHIEQTMSESGKKMIFHVESVRADAHGSVAHCKSADITLDTDRAGRLIRKGIV